MPKKQRLKKKQNVGLSTDALYTIEPLTSTQARVFKAYEDQNNLVLYGCAGTGKTFLALCMALRDVLSGNGEQDHIVLVRSCVPTRDVGFLPGTIEEKGAIYELPYRQTCNDLLCRDDGYDILKQKKFVSFIPTTSVRGLTFNNNIVIVDEVQNLVLEEIDTIVTRLGEGSRIILCGDLRQCDFGVGGKKKEASGIEKLLQIANQMNRFEVIEFFERDIVRSSLVAEWIKCRNRLED